MGKTLKRGGAKSVKRSSLFGDLFMCVNMVCKFCTNYDECDEIFWWKILGKYDTEILRIYCSVKAIEELKFFNPELKFELSETIEYD